MQQKNYSAAYIQFSKLAHNMRDASSAKAKDLQQSLSQLLQYNFPSIVLGLLYNALKNQFPLIETLSQEEIGEQGFEISFSEKRICKALSYEWFSKNHHASIVEKTQVFIAQAPVLFDDVKDFSRTSYKLEVDSYDSGKVWHLVYLDVMNKELVEFYKDLYSKVLLPRVYQMYQNPAIRFQVNHKGVCVVSDNNFLEAEAFTEVSQYNIKRLIDRILSAVEKNHRVVTTEELGLCTQIRILSKIFQAILAVDTSYNVSAGDQNLLLAKTQELSPIEQKIRTAIFELFKKLINQTRVLYFMTQDVYVDMILKQHPFFLKEDVIHVFEQGLLGLLPGVSRFSISVNKDHHKEKTVYFIPLNHVGRLFSQCNLKNNRFDLSQVFQRHFFLFLKRILHEYDAGKYDEQKIASVFDCSVELLKSIRQAIEHTTIK